MARHVLHGKRVRIPREYVGRAAHRAVSYAREMFMVRLAVWFAVHVLGPTTRPMLRDRGRLDAGLF